MPIRRLAAGVGALLLVVACTGGETAPPTAPPTTSTIGFAAISTPPPTVEVDPAVDGAVAEELVAEIDELKGEVETLRGLHFLDPPRVAIVTADQLAARHGAILDATFDRAGLDLDTRVLRMFGLLGSGEDVRSMLADLSTEPPTALYDPVAHAVVVDGSVAELGPAERSSVVRELVESLVDQYHRVSARTETLQEDGRHDESAALAALAESDASYFQFVYLQGLPEEEQQAVAETAGAAPPNLPPVVAEQLSLSAERGLGFVEELVGQGGTALLDSAYGNGLTTEGLMHPDRMLAGEGVSEMPDIEIGLDGYRVVDKGSLGEMALRSILAEAMPPDMLTQTADGWGADEAVTLVDNSGGEIAWVYSFKGDSVDDTVGGGPGVPRPCRGGARPGQPGGGRRGRVHRWSVHVRRPRGRRARGGDRLERRRRAKARDEAVIP